MKSNILRSAALFLIVILLSAVFAACGGETNEPGGGSGENVPGGSPGTDGDDENQEEARIEPNLPEAEFGGYTFTFLAPLYDNVLDWSTDEPRELVAETETGEPINDAVYIRNQAVMAKYGIEIDMITNSSEVSLLRRAVNAGDDVYDAVVIFNNNVPGAVTAGLLVDVSSLPYLDLEKPWWDDGVNGMSVANKQFLLAGDLLILDNEATNAIIFNKDLMANFGMELPYNLANEGKWTMDVMIEMTKEGHADLNGDGAMRIQDDRFSLLVFDDTLHAFLAGGGGLLADKDNNDMPFISFATPRNLQVIDKAISLMGPNENQGIFNIQAASDWESAYFGTFEEDRALFMWIRMRVIEALRGMESNFGILPMPKFDELQDRYYSLVNPYTGVLMGVPRTAGDLERTSIILEALSAESRYTLQPAYYDIVLDRKFMRDEESSEMLDIIFATQVYDIGGVYNFGSVFSDFLGLGRRQDRNIASFYERRIDAMNRQLERVVEQFEAID
jgi:ABC-type glycerol-3-phosphate transport system substrate-binding protein